jgi:hypothetical protein
VISVLAGLARFYYSLDLATALETEREPFGNMAFDVLLFIGMIQPPLRLYVGMLIGGPKGPSTPQ